MEVSPSNDSRNHVTIRVENPTEHVLLSTAALPLNPVSMLRDARLLEKVSIGIITDDEIAYPFHVTVSQRQANRMGRRVLKVAMSSHHNRRDSSDYILETARPLINWHLKHKAIEGIE